MSESAKHETKVMDVEGEPNKYYVFSAYYKHGETYVDVFDTEEELREAGIEKYKQSMKCGDPNGDDDNASGDYEYEHDDEDFLKDSERMNLGDFVDVVIDRSKALWHNEYGYRWVKVTKGLDVCGV